MTPAISVIVPVYKVEKYLDRCMKSVLGQTFDNLEIILVDDGSPDNCPALCDAYAASDKRIKVVHKKNQGLGLARNSGLAVATAPYVVFIDSDDWIDERFCEVLYHKICCTGTDAVICGYRFTDGQNVLAEFSGTPCEMTLSGHQCLELMLERKYNSNMSVWHGIYRRNVIVKHNLSFISERVIVSEDVNFTVEFLLASESVLLIPDILHNYFKNTCSITSVYSPGKYEKFLIAYNHVSAILNADDEFNWTCILETFYAFGLFDVLAVEAKQNSHNAVDNFTKIACCDKRLHEMKVLKNRAIPFKKRIILVLMKFNLCRIALWSFYLNR